MTVVGTRPEIIRLSRIIPRLDATCEHALVHTGQNFDERLSDIFIQELGLREPNHYLGATGPFGQQVGTILSGVEALLREREYDRFLVLGDTNSGLSAVIAKRLGVPVFHMEAGNRCYDDRVPEEVNRRIIDHASDVLLPYTERSRANLVREGIAGERIYVTGNPILEVLNYYAEDIARSSALDDLELKSRRYFLVTVHRAENVDVGQRLLSLVNALDLLQRKYEVPVIVSTHPRTRSRLDSSGIEVTNTQIRFEEPFGLFDFVKLEQNALCVLSDSGTVQEECAIFGVPNVTIRDVTERPETIECGSNVLSGAEPAAVGRCVRIVLDRLQNWKPPREYLMDNVTDVVVNVVLGYHHSILRKGASGSQAGDGRK